MNSPVLTTAIAQRVPPPMPQPQLTGITVVQAGWKCFKLGWCTFWIFGLGLVLFKVTLILGIVAICKNQVDHGIRLMLSALGSIIACIILVWFVIAVVCFGLFAGTAAVVTSSAAATIYEVNRMPPPPAQWPFVTPQKR